MPEKKITRRKVSNFLSTYNLCAGTWLLFETQLLIYNFCA